MIAQLDTGAAWSVLEPKVANLLGTFFICSDWPDGRTFLGYSGLLDSIRFALDPQANHFYFGPGV